MPEELSDLDLDNSDANVRRLQERAWISWYRYRQTRQLADMLNTVKLSQDVLDLTPENHVDRALRLANLGASVLNLFEHTGNIDDISQAINLEQQALELTPSNHADRALRLANLGESLQKHFQHTGNIDDIARAINLQQEVLELTPNNHPDRALRLVNFGSSFWNRFQHTGNFDDISRAIELEEEALALTPTNHPDRALRLTRLGSHFRYCFEHTGNMDDISRAIDLQQQALELTPNNHSDRALSLANLGSSFHNRFLHTGNTDDIFRAIDLEQQALELTPNNHAAKALRLAYLGSSFHSRFLQTGNMDDISKAIDLEQQALDLTRNNHTHRASRLANLGSSFVHRFLHTGNTDDISRAIDLGQQALVLTPNNHAARALRLANLGLSFEIRCRHSGNVNDISKAIELEQQALELTSNNHLDRAKHLANLGSFFQNRFMHTKNMDDISKAIQLQQQALELTPNNHIDRARTLANLGSSFEIRSRHSGNMDDILTAIDLQQQTLELTHSNHPDRALRLAHLGQSLFQYFVATHDKCHCEKAVTLVSEAVTSLSGSYLIRLDAAHLWVSFCITLGEPYSPHQAFVHGFEIISQMSGMAFTIKQRQQNLDRIVTFSHRGFSWALSSKKLDMALEWIELARCITWSQMNQLRSSLDALTPVDPLLAKSFSELSKALDTAASRSEFYRPYDDSSSMTQHIQLEQDTHHHKMLVLQWAECLAKIRTLDGFDDFLIPQKTSSILRNLPHNGEVILIMVLSERSDALALAHGRQEPLHIPLPDFNLKFARSFHQELDTLLRGRHSRSQENSSVQEDRAGRPKFKRDPKSVSFILGELWKRIVHPILQALGYATSLPSSERQRIWWCTTGPLALLPLHAAGIYNQHSTQPNIQTNGLCLSDYAISSYIPTVNTLLQKLKASTADNTSPQLLLISQSNTPGQMPIPATTIETHLLVNKMTSTRIATNLVEDEHGTVSHVTTELKAHNWVHFACHALQHPTDPLSSGLHLHDGKLSLLDIIRLHIPDAQFAFLSACQTCAGDITLSDEAFHLAAGMLAAGYRGVVATMWSIRDQYGPDVAADFYDYMLKEGKEGQLDCHDAAYALDYAMGQLKERLRSESVGLESALLTWVPYVHLGV